MNVEWKASLVVGKGGESRIRAELIGFINYLDADWTVHGRVNRFYRLSRFRLDRARPS